MVQGVELILRTNVCTLRKNQTAKLANLDCRNPVTVITQLISAVVKNRVRVPPVLWLRNLTSLLSLELRLRFRHQYVCCCVELEAPTTLYTIFNHLPNNEELAVLYYVVLCQTRRLYLSNLSLKSRCMKSQLVYHLIHLWFMSNHYKNYYLMITLHLIILHHSSPFYFYKQTTLILAPLWYTKIYAQHHTHFIPFSSHPFVSMVYQECPSSSSSRIYVGDL